MNGFGDPEEAANGMLGELLERLAPVIDRVGRMHGGAPLFAVEQALADELRKAFPGVRFLPADIRDWSLKLSS